MLHSVSLRSWPAPYASSVNKIPSTGFYNVALAILTFVFLICSIRTNACLFLGLFLLVITYGVFAGAYFQLALGEAERASKLQYVSYELVYESTMGF